MHLFCVCKAYKTYGIEIALFDVELTKWNWKFIKKRTAARPITGILVQLL